MTRPGSVKLRSFHLLSKRSTFVVAVILTSFLGGCTTASRGTTDSFRLLTGNGIRISPGEVAKSRFPQAQVSTPDLSALIVLGYVDSGLQTWYAGSHAVFRMNSKGLLLGTSGLGRDLRARILGSSPFERIMEVDAPVKVNREYDWLPAYKFGVSVTGTLSPEGIETVEILGQKMRLARFEEALEGGGMRGRNIYWADTSTGFVLKSRQYLAPDYAVDLVQLKPYQEADD